MGYIPALIVALSFGVAAHSATPPTPPALSKGDLNDRIVNDPRPVAFNPYGLRIPPRVRNDKSVQFGKALRMPIDSAAPPDFRIGVTLPVLKPIKRGDKVVIAFWARAHETEGGAPGKIARVQLEHSKLPHRALFAQPVVVGPEWRMHQISGVADADYGPMGLNAAMHLAAAKQVIDIGPVFVLRYQQ